MEEIVIKGAREHNLKNIDITIPRDRLVVITGISGSGKSSLAFDTIYAEGQRRYVESLSAYARQFLEQMDKPDVESIEGLSPAISIEQKTTSKNPRSTVGTVTEVYDYLRLLYARIGIPHCYKCKSPITSQSVQQMVDGVMELDGGTKIEILAPIVRGRKGEYKKELLRLRREGYTKVLIDGRLRELSEDITLDKRKKHYIDVVIDRLVIKDSIIRRLADSLEVASDLASGMVKVLLNPVAAKADEKRDDSAVLLFNEKLSCIKCSISYDEITHAFFSFNSPHGACPECKGLGEKFYFDPELVVPDKRLSLADGAVTAWSKKAGYYRQIFESLASHAGFSTEVPFNKLTEKAQNLILYGSGEEEIEFDYKREKGRYTFKESYEGVLANLERRYHETDSADVRTDLEEYMNAQPCPTCKGARLKAEALSVKINGKSIGDVVKLSIKEGLTFFEGLKLTKNEEIIASRILKEITERLGFLVNVGLNYISLDRPASTLSGGEGQRIRLATQIGSSLVGVLYILDEPSIGLHQRDNQKLLSALMSLRDMGNTVLVVEHDEETIREADFIIDMGPGAGEHGGEVVATGPCAEIIKNKRSITGKYLSGVEMIPIPKERLKDKGRYLTIKGATTNNLKNLDVKFPLGLMTCVTGVSGSGKSTLVMETLLKNLSKTLYRSRARAGSVVAIEGTEFIDKVIDIDQSPIGRTPRSNPATYTGLFTHIRELFSQLPEAKIRGFGPGRFSFNVKGGRCETCRGEGVIKVEMHFLPDVYVHCDECNCKRYNRDTLEITYKGKNISECLDMTVTEALEFFKNIPHVRTKLQTLYDVGLGYIRLGQAATTLSGGEAQRIKLTKELSKRATGKTLYIL
ncbi:MAG: excinuclease ABC subunit UvrA, partial [Proteobacteria bacterium]|nr:excinuclease ABC subunit UvrA [Pseudomonadota bacterium]